MKKYTNTTITTTSSNTDSVTSPEVLAAKFQTKKQKPFRISLHVVQFYNWDLFINKILPTLKSGGKYTILIRLKYSDTFFKMAGQQYAMVFDHMEKLKVFHKEGIVALNSLIERYDISENHINDIQLIISEVNTKFLSDYAFDESYLEMSKSNTKIIKNQIKLFPISDANKVLGKPIEREIVNDEVVGVNVNVDNKNINLIQSIRDREKINKEMNIEHEPAHFDKDSEFYLRDANKPDVVIAVNKVGNTTNKKAYSISGNLIDYVDDTLIKPNLIKRTRNKKSILTKDSEISYISDHFSFSPIKVASVINKTDDNKSKRNYTSNSNIGVIDLETFKHRSATNAMDTAHVYAAGL